MSKTNSPKFYARFEETEKEVLCFDTLEARDNWVNFQDVFSKTLGETQDDAFFGRMPLTANQAKYIIQKFNLVKTVRTPNAYEGCTEIFAEFNFNATEMESKPMKINKNISFEPTMDIEQRKMLASTTVINAFTIGTKKIAYIPVALLNIPKFQRERKNHVYKIAENWEDSKCHVLLVSYEPTNGWFNIINGQHRAAAAKMRGIEYLVCEIFQGLTESKEAALFVDANESSKKLNPYDTYKANLYIREEDDTELSKLDKRISKVCERYGVQVKASQACGVLKTVPHARTIMKREGEDGLSFIFDVVQGSHWDKFPNGYSYVVMESLRKIYDNHSGDIDYVKTRLCKYLSKSNPREIESIGNSKFANLGRTARWDAVLAEVIN